MWYCFCLITMAELLINQNTEFKKKEKKLHQTNIRTMYILAVLVTFNLTGEKTMINIV